MDGMVHVLLFIALLSAVLLGGLLAVFQLPGTWFMLLATLAYAWYYDFQQVGWVPLAIMAVVAAVAEVAETLAGVRGARRAGASRAASWGALIGGFAGLIVFTPLIPIPIVGSIIGGLAGCFGGAYLMECRAHGDHVKGTNVAMGAVLGRLVGLLLKMFAAFVMAGIAIGCGLLVLRGHFLS